MRENGMYNYGKAFRGAIRAAASNEDLSANSERLLIVSQLVNYMRDAGMRVGMDEAGYLARAAADFNQLNTAVRWIDLMLLGTYGAVTTRETDSMLRAVVNQVVGRLARQGTVSGLREAARVAAFAASRGVCVRPDTIQALLVGACDLLQHDVARDAMLALLASRVLLLDPERDDLLLPPVRPDVGTALWALNVAAGPGEVPDRARLAKLAWTLVRRCAELPPALPGFRRFGLRHQYESSLGGKEKDPPPWPKLGDVVKLAAGGGNVDVGPLTCRTRLVPSLPEEQAGMEAWMCKQRPLGRTASIQRLQEAQPDHEQHCTVPAAAYVTFAVALARAGDVAGALGALASLPSARSATPPQSDDGLDCKASEITLASLMPVIEALGSTSDEIHDNEVLVWRAITAADPDAACDVPLAVLVAAYAFCGDLDRAVLAMESAGTHTGRAHGGSVALCYAALIRGCGMHMEAESAMEIAREMEERGIKHTRETTAELVHVCVASGRLDDAAAVVEAGLASDEPPPLSVVEKTLATLARNNRPDLLEQLSPAVVAARPRFSGLFGAVMKSVAQGDGELVALVPLMKKLGLTRFVQDSGAGRE
ncbi:unnamed protein product [Pedinophyceae sp. YPF-701]|nr:unnamed protein product [Pedinophyceae sp. YPF-701]